MSKYTFHEETFRETYAESVPLTVSHHEEIDLFGEGLDVHTDLYLEVEKHGGLRFYVIRDQENKLVGYSIFFLYIPTHHKTSLHAKQDVLFVKKENRGIGISFLKFCDEQLKKSGVDVVLQCVPKCNDWSLVLKRLGYKELETIYSRRL